MGQLIKTYSTYEIAIAAAAAAANATLAQIIKPGGPATMNLGLVGLTITQTTAVASMYALAYAATDGTFTPASSPLGVRVSLGNGGSGAGPVGRLAGAWTVVPTYQATPSYLRREQAPNTIGYRIQWTWPDDDPLVLNSPSNAASLLLRNVGVGASAAILVSARWMEYFPSS